MLGQIVLHDGLPSRLRNVTLFALQSMSTLICFALKEEAAPFRGIAAMIK
jgi:hypothetical protein